MIYIGADHQGFELKEQLKDYFSQHSIDYYDCGNISLDPEDDYTDFAFSVAEKVRDNLDAHGILICKSGEGMSIAANKVKGVRAALCFDIEHTKLSREHNNANVLVLDIEVGFRRVLEMIEIFLATPFSNEERHLRRIKKIAYYENKS